MLKLVIALQFRALALTNEMTRGFTKFPNATIMDDLGLLNMEAGDLDEFEDTFAHSLADIACVQTSLACLETHMDGLEDEMDATDYVAAATRCEKCEGIIYATWQKAKARNWIIKDFDLVPEGQNLMLETMKKRADEQAARESAARAAELEAKEEDPK